MSQIKQRLNKLEAKTNQDSFIILHQGNYDSEAEMDAHIAHLETQSPNLTIVAIRWVDVNNQ